MKLRFLLLAVFWTAMLSLTGQTFTAAEREAANTAKDATYLTQAERELIYYTNLARINGSAFFSTYVLADYHKNRGNSYYESLKKDLMATKGLAPLQPHEALTRAAVYHAEDMGGKGKIGHTSSNGWGLRKRFEQLGVKWGASIAENCSYGNEDPLAILLLLLVDEGVSSLGHRKNCLNPHLGYIGVAIRPHKGYRFNSVMDFAGTMEE